MKKYLVLFFICLFVCGCGEKEEVVNKNEDDKINLQEVIESSNYILLDVRTKEEYDEEHIEGSINIPYDEIDDKINLDKEKVILVYCKSGTRSSMAYEKLKELGYEVIDLGEYSYTLSVIEGV